MLAWRATKTPITSKYNTKYHTNTYYTVASLHAAARMAKIMRWTSLTTASTSSKVLKYDGLRRTTGGRAHKLSSNECVEGETDEAIFFSSSAAWMAAASIPRVELASKVTIAHLPQTGW